MSGNGAPICRGQSKPHSLCSPACLHHILSSCRSACLTHRGLRSKCIPVDLLLFARSSPCTVCCSMAIHLLKCSCLVSTNGMSERESSSPDGYPSHTLSRHRKSSPDCTPW